MAPSTFMGHFKAFDSLSSIQFQKRLRLYETRRFSRDYRLQFGETPGRSTRKRREKMRER